MPSFGQIIFKRKTPQSTVHILRCADHSDDKQLLMTTNDFGRPMKNDIAMKIARAIIQIKKWHEMEYSNESSLPIDRSKVHYVISTMLFVERHEKDDSDSKSVHRFGSVWFGFAKCTIDFQIKWHSKRFTMLCSSFEWTCVNEIDILS